LARVHPRRRIEERAQRLDDLGEALARAGRSRLRERADGARALIGRMIRLKPSTQIQRRRDRLDQLGHELPLLVRAHVRRNRDRLHAAEDRLRLLSPHETLKRGYSITFDARSGKVVRSVKDVASGTALRTKLVDGDVSSRAS
jgi:exodeoxyribonuclease VII large subunit